MKKMLVADNTEMNKSILYEIFGSQYEFIHTDSSEVFFRLMVQYRNELSIALINESVACNLAEESADTLTSLNVFENIPLILILNDEGQTIRSRNIHIPYSDVIHSPVNPVVVKRRVANLVELFSHKTTLEKLVRQQTQKILEQNETLKIQQKKINSINNDMLETLSTIIEYRDVESGRHIHRIQKFTEVLLNVLAKDYPKYQLTEEKIALITSASSLHDIGKITIPDSILLSPRRLTYDEFKIMKQHTVRGCEILEQLESVEKNEYYNYCYDICRYHHEKYDGLGYPDGLAGDQIPIWAQVVSLADCYDALTSERPYKAAYSHEEAVEMLRSGACGAFSDEIMDCFSKVLPQFKALAKEYADVNHKDRNISDNSCHRFVRDEKIDHTRDIYLKMDRDELIKTLERQKQYAEKTHQQDCRVIYSASDFVFEFDMLYGACVERKGDFTAKIGYTPRNYEEAVNIFSQNCSDEYQNKFIRTFRMENIKSELERGSDRISLECLMHLKNDDFSAVKCSVIPVLEDGKLVRIVASGIILKNALLPENSENDHRDHDTVTGLWNFGGMKRETDDFLRHSGRNGYHMLLVIDIDNFRTLNRRTSYQFGNDILKDIAALLKRELDESNIIGRIEDDNFMLFINDCPKDENGVAVVDTIFHCLHRSYTFDGKTYPELSACIGVASYPSDGQNFEELFFNASRAVDIAKINGKNMYLFYNESMKKSWEIEKYSAIPRVEGSQSIELVEFDKCFVPVADSGSGLIMYYDFMEISDEYGTDFEDIYDSVYYSSNITALSLNSLKRLMSAVYLLGSEGISLPELSVMTMFDGRDCETILKAIGEILVQYPVPTENFCIMLSQHMLESMGIKQLTAFIAELRNFGFKVGVYNAGGNNFNIKCFTEGLFDRVVFASSFLSDIQNGIYPAELLVYFISYFSELGTEPILPENADENTIGMLRDKTHFSFGIHQNEKIMFNDFKEQMKVSAVVHQYPILSHENNSLALSEKMYDEILEQTRSFIIEWSPRTDSIKISDSFGKLYGYALEQTNFIRNVKDRTFLHSDDVLKFIAKLNDSRSNAVVSDCLLRVYRKSSDSYLWNKVSFVCVRSTAGIPAKIVVVFADISEEHSNGDIDNRKDRTDYITNLYNKQATENKIQSFLYEEGVSGHHALIVAEICGFDKLENGLGTVFANAVLKETAQNIRDLFRDSDIIGRSSGSHFTVFVKNMNNTGKLSEKARQICAAINHKYQSEEGDIRIFGKAGISMFPQCGKSYDELYAEALKALYFAKHSVTDAIAFSPSLDLDIKLLHS